MPYFKWYGVTMIGQIQRGRLFAQSKEHLEEQLLKRHIALLKERQVRVWSPFFRITLAHKIGVFRQLCVLVSSGVLLSDALFIVAQQADNIRLQEVMYLIAEKVRQGVSFSAAMQEYPKLFDAMTIQLVHVGQESGNLAMALDSLCSYLEEKRDFYARVRAALFMPMITLGFFLIVASIIFIVIIPRFADMFAALGKELPAITKTMIRISTVLLSWYSVWIIGGLIVFWLLLKAFSWSVSGKRIYDYCAVHVPLFGSIVRYRFVAHTFESLSLLLAGGMQLVPALQAVERTIQNTQLRDIFRQVTEDVASGNSLADALFCHSEKLFAPDIIALLKIGQEVGNIDVMLKQASRVYNNRLKQQLVFISTILQPLVLIILGLLILTLIFAVYVPILNMSYAV
ncbi:MAG: type II secretion system F family protein [bacterium]|nr:type II secretion system F family protein [bacterium]